MGKHEVRDMHNFQGSSKKLQARLALDVLVKQYAQSWGGILPRFLDLSFFIHRDRHKIKKSKELGPKITDFLPRLLSHLKGVPTISVMCRAWKSGLQTEEQWIWTVWKLINRVPCVQRITLSFTGLVFETPLSHLLPDHSTVHYVSQLFR